MKTNILKKKKRFAIISIIKKDIVSNFEKEISYIFFFKTRKYSLFGRLETNYQEMHVFYLSSFLKDMKQILSREQKYTQHHHICVTPTSIHACKVAKCRLQIRCCQAGGTRVTCLLMFTSTGSFTLRDTYRDNPLTGSRRDNLEPFFG